MKRILSLDIMRGIAIFFMVVVHTWMNVYNMDSLRNLDIGTVNPLILAFGMFMFILGHSRTFFLLISASIHTYLNFTRIRAGYNPKALLWRNIGTGILIYVIGLIREAIFNPWGILDKYWQTGEWDVSELKSIYIFETLQMIGIGVIFLSVTLYILVSIRQKYEFEETTADRLYNIVFIILGSAFIFSAPYIHNLTNNHLGFDSEFDYHDVEGSLSTYLVRFFWVGIAGAQEPIFPYLGIVYLGAYIGYYLAKPKVTPNFVRNLYLAGLLFMVTGILYWVLIEGMVIDIWFQIHPTWFLVFNSGFHLTIIGFIMNRIEFNPRLDHQQILRRTQFIRRWSMLSLTIYVFQIIDIIPRELFTRLLDVEFKTRGQVNLGWTIFMIIIVILLWETILRVWEKFNYVGSWEWIFVVIRQQFFDRSGLNNKKIDVDETLYNVELIQFVAND